jgi:phospholipid-binding lipoprotein MlaA
MRFGVTIAATAAFFLLSGCATLPNGKADPRDPFERANRSIYGFNNGLDKAIFRPTARAWKAVMPVPVRRGISNFANNLGYPGTIINDLLQGKFAQGGHDFTRLVINTVFGFGFFDPATKAGLERHDEDFGQTLGKWGVPAGPYIMLPIFGPSSVRDAPARLADDYTDARHYISNPYVNWGIWGIDKIETRASLLDLDAALDRTFDPYAFIRNAWIQRRQYLVRDGEPESDTSIEDPGIEDPEPPSEPPAQPPTEPPAK